MDTTGLFLYVVNRESKAVSAYVVNRATGELTPMEGQTFTAGAKPVAIIVPGATQ